MTEAEIRQMQLQTKACQGSPATTKSYGFPGGAVAKNLPANAGGVRDMGSVLGSGRSPGEGNGNSL